jgi:hypothetical protein
MIAAPLQKARLSFFQRGAQFFIGVSPQCVVRAPTWGNPPHPCSGTPIYISKAADLHIEGRPEDRRLLEEGTLRAIQRFSFST